MKISNVKIPPGRRPVDEATVAMIAESIGIVGLINPITVLPDGTLVSGLHRLRAVERRGETEIDVNVKSYSEADREIAELVENLARNDGTALDRAENLSRLKDLYEARHPETKRGANAKEAADARWDAKRNDFASHDSDVPEVDDESEETFAPAPRVPAFAASTAAKIGMTPRSVQHDVQIATKISDAVREQIREVPKLADNKTELLRIARLPAADQAAVVERMAAGSPNVRSAKKHQIAERIAAEPPPMPKGPYRVIVADPPWSYDKRADDETHRAALPYPPMTIEQIRALPVGELAHEDAILWLWTTNAHMREAYTVLDAWGFKERTILTWTKDRMGTGDWLRGKSEHCILAIRGKPTVTLSNQTTVLAGPLREHSRKPDEFFALVDALCPGSKVETFAREPRKGWAAWGGEVDKFAGAAK